MSNFKLINKDNHSSARRAVLDTAHGKIQTPVFMPVGTAGAVKGITPEQLKKTGATIILANTYHMLLRPGVETVEKLGGLHKLMAWPQPILTDSGGYQVFSLGFETERHSQHAAPAGPLTKIDDNGVQFTSHLDGKNIYLNPEIATNIQNRLGADIIMCFDQCTPFPCQQPQLEKAVQRTISWASECKQAHKNPDQLLFGIVQGGVDLQLRTLCAKELTDLDFNGYAIGGLSVGEGHENMVKTVSHTAAILPESKPRYLMGVGTPADIVAAVAAGVDMFDCVLPTRNGRNAFAFTPNGPLRLRNSTHTNDKNPIDPNCHCYCCENFSRGTIRHFFNTREMLGPILVSIHNLTFYQALMAKIRQKIEENEFAQWAKKFLKNQKNTT